MIAVSNGMPDIVGMLLVFGARDECLHFREQILNQTKAVANADSLKLVILLSIVAGKLFEFVRF